MAVPVCCVKKLAGTIEDPFGLIAIVDDVCEPQRTRDCDTAIFKHLGLRAANNSKLKSPCACEVSRTRESLSLYIPIATTGSSPILLGFFNVRRTNQNVGAGRS